MLNVILLNKATTKNVSCFVVALLGSFVTYCICISGKMSGKEIYADKPQERTFCIIYNSLTLISQDCYCKLATKQQYLLFLNQVCMVLQRLDTHIKV